MPDQKLQLIRGLNNCRQQHQNGAITIGNFDGVHLGHQAILRYVVKRADDLGTAAATMTFDPHPVKLLRPKKAPRLLSNLDQRLELIERTGVETALVVPFTHRLARMPAADGGAWCRHRRRWRLSNSMPASGARR